MMNAAVNVYRAHEKKFDAILSVVLGLAIWQLVDAFLIHNPLVAVGPARIAEAFVRLSARGEIANVLPSRNRSMTGHPTDARNGTAAIGGEPSSGARYDRRRGQTRATARPMRSPLTTSLGKWTPR